MIYIVTEIQTNANNTAAILTNTFTDRAEAESNYHYVLSFAVKSALPVHTVILSTNDGRTIEYKCYKHDIVEPEEETYGGN